MTKLVIMETSWCKNWRTGTQLLNKIEKNIKMKKTLSVKLQVGLYVTQIRVWKSHQAIKACDLQVKYKEVTIYVL